MSTRAQVAISLTEFGLWSACRIEKLKFLYIIGNHSGRSAKVSSSRYQFL